MSYLAGDGVCVRCRETVQPGGQPLKWRVGLPHRIYLQALATQWRTPSWLIPGLSRNDNQSNTITSKRPKRNRAHYSGTAVVAQYHTIVCGFLQATGFQGLPNRALCEAVCSPDECRKHTSVESHAASTGPCSTQSPSGLRW